MLSGPGGGEVPEGIPPPLLPISLMSSDNRGQGAIILTSIPFVLELIVSTFFSPPT